MKAKSDDKLLNLEKAWESRLISEDDYLMWKKVYKKNADSKTVAKKRQTKSGKN